MYCNSIFSLALDLKTKVGLKKRFLKSKNDEISHTIA